MTRRRGPLGKDQYHLVFKMRLLCRVLRGVGLEREQKGEKGRSKTKKKREKAGGGFQLA